MFERAVVGLEDLDLLVLGSDDVAGGVGEGFEDGIELIRQAGDDLPARKIGGQGGKGTRLEFMFLLALVVGKA